MSIRAPVIALLLMSALACGGKKIGLRGNEELYREAREQLQVGKYMKARKTLGLVGVAEPVEPDLDPSVKLATADAFFFQGGGLNLIEAQSRYQQFLNFYPTHPLAPYAQYQVGECLLIQSAAPTNDQEFTVRAVNEFRKVADLDPRSSYARAAEARIDTAHGKLAEREWIVARFYGKRRRWDAVVGRLQGLLDRFPRFARRDEVFLMLGRALIETDSVTEGRVYLQKLLADDPDGEFGVEARELLARAERGAEG